MREIGGYLELERFSGEPYHKEAIALNSGRGCFAYLAELREIRRIWIPDLMCGSVPALFRREGVEVLTYPVGTDLLPDYAQFEVSDGEWMLLADHYGQLRGEDVFRALSASCGNLVVDESQGFFRAPWEGADTVYTCRKWFGVADGAYLATADGARLARELPRDESRGRMGFVLGRFECPASEFYAEASENNALFAGEPAKAMSPITENLLRAIDYRKARERRDSNWDVLHAALSEANGLRLRKPEGAFMYPFMTDGAQRIREKLIQERIYVPLLWPDVAGGAEGAAGCVSRSVLPLPLDQRYGEREMDWMLEVLRKCLS